MRGAPRGWASIRKCRGGGLATPAVGSMQYMTFDVQAVWAQEDEAGVGVGGAECVKDSKEEDEEETVGEVGNRRRGRTTGDEL